MTSTSSAGDPWAELPADWDAGSRFDGRETGCGEMLIDLKIHVEPLDPGTRLAVRATDPGAPLEIPAWCRVTGHALLGAEHPFYLIRVRGSER